MPISNEVIELVPAGKSKNKLIIFIVAAAVCLALAVTFLVLYLIKPNVEERPIIVNQVTIVNNDLFSANEDGKTVNYASVGTEYSVSADVSVEEGATKSVIWDVSPSGAVTRTESSVGDEAAGGAFYKFKPNNDYHGKEVTIKATSASDGTKVAEFKFTIVNQGAETVNFLKYAVNGKSDTTTDITSDVLELPIYVGENQLNNYVVHFEQLGRYNESTDKYLPVTVIGSTEDDYSNKVVVESEKPNIVNIIETSASRSFFAFAVSGLGESTVTLTANVNNPSETIVKQLKIVVKSTSQLGYVDNFYVFNEPIVNAEFIESVLNNTKTDVDKNKVEQYVKDHAEITVNKSVTLPYNSSYENIFDHVLVSPVSIQYAEGALKNKWYENIGISTTASSNVIDIKPSSETGNKTLSTKNTLTSGETDAAKCEITFTDNKTGSKHTKRNIELNIIAKNTSGVGNVKIGSSVYPATEEKRASTIPGATSAFVVTYNISMPKLSDDKLASAVGLNYLTRAYKLEYDESRVSVKLKDSEEIIKSGKTMTLPADAMTLTWKSGTDSTSIYEGAVEFTVTTASTTADGDEFSVKFTKLGTFFQSEDGDWDKTVFYKVNKVATEANFITDASKAQAIATNNGQFAGKFKVEQNKKVASLYVQNQENGTRFTELFTVDQLVEANGAAETSVKFDVDDMDVFESKDSGKNMLFKGGSLGTKTDKRAVITLTVKQVGATTVVDTFTINVYVFDAVTVFAEIGSDTRSYNAADFSAAKITLDSAAVRVSRYLSKDYETYSNYDIEISYGHENGKYLFLDKEVIEGVGMKFSYKGTELYEITKAATGSSRVLNPLCDIYEFSVKQNKRFSNILVHFVLPENEYFTGDKAPAGLKNCIFLRKADDIAVFTDGDYSESSRLELGENAANEPVNQGEEIPLFVSSVIRLSDQTEIIARSLNAANAANSEDSYIIVGSDYNPGGTTDRDDNSGNNFYDVVFVAPSVPEGLVEFSPSFELTSPSRAVNKKLCLTIQNKARAIQRIEILNEDKTAAITAEDLMFGSYNNDKTALTQKTVYIGVTYKKYSSSDLYFESAVLTVPDFVTAKVGNTTIDGNEIKSITLAAGDEELKNVNQDATDGEYTKYYACVLTLKNTVESGNGNSGIFVHSISLNTSQEYNVSASVGVSVGTGLGGIVATVNGQSVADNNYPHVFALANAADARSVEIEFAFNSMMRDYGIDYNVEDCDISVSEVYGLSYVNGIKSDGKFTLMVDTAKLKTMKNTPFTVTFTDKAGGANREFVFTIDVTVTMDIFDVKFDDTCNFNMETSGDPSSNDEISAEIKVIYNNGNDNIQPESGLVPELYTENNGVYTKTDMDGFRIALDGGKYMLYVKNSVTKIEGNLYVGVYRSDSVKAYKRVYIQTKSHHIELAEGDGNIAVVDGKTSVTVTRNTDKFKLVANVINDGTEQVVAGKKAAYGIYTDPACENPATATAISINSDGIITIHPDKITDTVWYKASYKDVGGTGETYSIIVALTYYVGVTGVELDESVLDGGQIKLFYAASTGNNFTTVDLKNHIRLYNAFAGLTHGNGVTIEIVSENSDKLAVEGGYTLVPKATGNVKITVRATYGNSVAEKEYVVNTDLVNDFSLESTSGTLNIAEDGSAVTIVPNIATRQGLDHTYTVTGGTGVLTISGEGNNKTVTAVRAASSLGSHVLTATLTYTPQGAFGGSIVFEKTYTVNVVNDFTADFKLFCGDSEIAEKSSSAIDTNKTYKLVVDTSGYGNVEIGLGVTSTNGIISFADSWTGAGNNEKTFTFNEKSSGETEIIVTVTLFDRSSSILKWYTFTDGLTASAKLTYNGGADEYTEYEQSVDYAGATPKIFRYTVSGVGGIASSDVYVFINGMRCTWLERDDSQTAFYVDIEAVYVGVLTVYGYVKVGGFTVYLKEYSVELTATAPDFEVETSANTIAPTDTTPLALGIKQTEPAFRGNYTTTYQIISGGELAEIVGGTTIKAKSNVIYGGAVVVRATIKVEDGIFKGTYYATKTFTVTGVALPTVSFNDGDKYFIEAGKPHTFAHTLTNGFTASYGYEVINVGGGLTVDDIVKNGNQVSVKSTVKAGGKFTLKVTATITSDIHNGATVSDTIEIIVLPQVSVDGVTIGNAKQTIDFNDIIEVDNTVGATKYIDFKNYSGVDFTVNGTKLIVVGNITERTELDLIATVVFTGGNCNGRSVTAEFKVTVEVMSALGALTAEWNNANGAYNAVDANTGITGATSITMTASGDNAKYVTVNDNNTLAVDKNANTSLTASAVAKDVTLEYYIVKEGKSYALQRTLSVPPVVINVTGASEGIADVTQGSMTAYIGDTFEVNLTASVGTESDVNSTCFKVAITNITVNGMDVKFAGDKAMFTVPSSVGSDSSFGVTITYTVGGITGSMYFVVTVKQPTTNAFNVNKTEKTLNVGESSDTELVSTWTYNSGAYSSYRYGDSLTVATADGKALSTYFSAITASWKTSSDTEGVTKTINDMSKTSASMSMDRYYNSGKLTELTLTFNVNTGAAFDRSLITATLKLYSKNYGGSSTDVTVRYYFKVSENEYTVSFNANGGNIDTDYYPANIKVVNGSTYGMLPVPTREHYVFGGWYLDEEFKGGKITSNTTVNLTADTVLYAKWTAKEIAVTLVTGGGTLDPSWNHGNEPDIKIGGNYNLPTDTELVRDGYEFKGWFTAPEGGTKIDNGAVVTTENIYTVLYAQWTEIPVDPTVIKLDVNDGNSEHVITFDVNAGGEFGAHRLIKPERDGFIFLGWFDQKEGGELQDGPIEIVPNKTTTLFAHWAEIGKDVTVTVKLNYAGAADQTQSVQVGATVGTLTKPEREGYTFKGWFDAEENGNKISEETVITAEMTVYAQWEQVTGGGDNTDTPVADGND